MVPDVDAEGGSNKIRQLHISSFGSSHRDPMDSGADAQGRAPFARTRYRDKRDLFTRRDESRQIEDGGIDDAEHECRLAGFSGCLAACREQLEAVAQVWTEPQGKGVGPRWRGRHLSFRHARLLLPNWTLWSSIGVTPHNQVAVDEDV